MKNRLFTLTTLLALLVAMVATTSAFAQSAPGEEVYNPNGEVLNVVQGGGTDPVPSDTVPAGGTKNVSHATPRATVERATAPAAAPATQAVVKGQLPFTGFQAGLVGAAGLALLGTGVAMRRVARKS